jgi:hypothetical protein
MVAGPAMFPLWVLVAVGAEAHPLIPPAPPAAPAPAIEPIPDAPTPPSLVAAPGRASSPWLGLAILTVLATGAARSPRRVRVAILGGFLLVLVAESSVHAVHHLGDARGAAQCQVLSLSQHLSGDRPAPVEVQPPARKPSLEIVVPAPSLVPDLALRPDRGRAPPAVPA